MDTYRYILRKHNISPKHKYVIDIPNMDRDGLADLFAELEFEKGVEVGVEKGRYSEVLLKANPNLHLSCVDPWSTLAYAPGIDAVDYEQPLWDKYYEETVYRLKPYAHRTTIIRDYSVRASQHFHDNSLDFVYIDGNHDFLNVTQDIDAWKKKIRPGGILSGHDYAYFSYKKHNHVKRVLEAYTRCYRMIPYFVVGAMEYHDGWKRDKYRSWFWVKR